MTDYDFYFDRDNADNVTIMELAKHLGTLLEEGYGTGEHPDFLRLAVWIYRNHYLEAPKIALDDALELAEKEQEMFVGDYDSKADACQSIHENYFDNDEESTRNLVIDWGASWDYSYGYDFDSATYTKRQEPSATDVFPMSTFGGAGFWAWDNN